MCKSTRAHVHTQTALAHFVETLCSVHMIWESSNGCMASRCAHPSGTPNAQVWRPDWLVTATMNWMTANTRHASWKAKQIQPMTQHPKLKFCATHAQACQHVPHDLCTVREPLHRTGTNPGMRTQPCPLIPNSKLDGVHKSLYSRGLPEATGSLPASTSTQTCSNPRGSCSWLGRLGCCPSTLPSGRRGTRAI